MVEPELFTEQEIGAIRAPEPEKAEPQLPNPIVSTVLSPSAPRPENEVPGTEDYTMRRRTIESTLLRVLPESIHFENEVICQLCESLRAEHACLWLVPPDLGTIWDWGRKTIIAEAAAQSHNQNPFTHTPPPREWAIQYLDPILRATGATVFNVPPPFQPGGNPNARSNYLAIALTGHPGYRWAMMFERSGPPWRESDAMLLEDQATTLSLALEGRLLAKQSIERGTYLNNLLNSSDIAVMVIEQTTPGRPVITSASKREGETPFARRFSCVELLNYTQAEMEEIIPKYFANLGFKIGECASGLVRRLHRGNMEALKQVGEKIQERVFGKSTLNLEDVMSACRVTDFLPRGLKREEARLLDALATHDLRP